MKVLVISTMFPNKVQPVHAVFVRNRVQHVAKLCDLIVLSPIPYFPFTSWISKYSHRNAIPRQDVIQGIDVRYPRFLSLPAVLKPLDGLFLFLSIWWAARKLRKTFDFELIDSHLAYPDGYAAALLGWLIQRPITVTLRGHDVNDLPRFPVRKRQVQFALRRAKRVIGVADALRRAAVELGAEAGKTDTVSNGVDTLVFHRVDKGEARRRLGLPANRKIVISVGHLVERKGFDLIVDALNVLRSQGLEVPFLVIVGAPGEEGDHSRVIQERIALHRLGDSVLFAGAQLNHELCDWYGAADVSCLASSKEGWANVLLESLACGTPVVATNVWGTPEVITSPEYGVLVERTPESIAEGLRVALARQWDPASIEAYARGHTWTAVAERVLKNFKLALGEPDRDGRDSKLQGAAGARAV